MTEVAKYRGHKYSSIEEAYKAKLAQNKSYQRRDPEKTKEYQRKYREAQKQKKEADKAERERLLAIEQLFNNMVITGYTASRPEPAIVPNNFVKNINIS